MKNTIPTLTADVLVIGSGAAGMATALALAPLNVLLVTKTAGLIGGSTAAAQGGIATVIKEPDTPQQHATDTHTAGAGLTNVDAVRLLTEQGANVVEKLLALNMPFDRDNNGNICVGLEAAHSTARIVHAGGDATGWHLSQTLAKAVEKARHIEVISNSHIAELIKENGVIIGAWGWHTKQGWFKMQAKQVVLATGGSGQLFSHTTNPATNTADGQALAYKAGATLTDMEFVQFHPTALAVSTNDGKQPLLTEALRGSGGNLVNNNGERFMQKLHKDAELAPRDIVARSVWAQLAEGNTPYLDVRHIADVAKKFPTVFNLCQEHGLDPQTDLLPVAPAAHYHMGGVETDLTGATDIAGLWAVGEVAATGVHGANRLASNSLLECLVFAKTTANAIKQQPLQRVSLVNHTTPPELTLPTYAKVVRGKLRAVMYRYCGLIRDEKGLKKGLVAITKLADVSLQKATAETIATGIEINNMLQVANLVLNAALTRTESRGGHYRTDFKNTSDEWKTHILLNNKNLETTEELKEENAHESAA